MPVILFAFLGTFLSFLPFSLAQTGSPPSQWEEFISYEGGFRVITPEPLAEKIDSIPTSIGVLSYHTFYYSPVEEDPENFFYMVSYCDYPEGTVHSDSTQLLKEFFQATVEEAVYSVEGELMYADDLLLDGYPGKIWRILFREGKAVVKTKAIVAGRRYYAVQTVTLRKKSLNTASDRFLESFRLL